ncbi:hypothetical protein EIP86_000656 [Pleurotus ostreatoroseus]|nr:hypothetical protein EIP86_000656 [Pleurotus ostreatoroseus]
MSFASRSAQALRAASRRAARSTVNVASKTQVAVLLVESRLLTSLARRRSCTSAATGPSPSFKSTLRTTLLHSLATARRVTVRA